MSKCETCNSKTILMSGFGCGEPDESSEQDAKAAEIDEVEFSILFRYCPKCKKPTEIWHE